MKIFGPAPLLAAIFFLIATSVALAEQPSEEDLRQQCINRIAPAGEAIFANPGVNPGFWDWRVLLRDVQSEGRLDFGWVRARRMIDHTLKQVICMTWLHDQAPYPLIVEVTPSWADHYTRQISIVAYRRDHQGFWREFYRQTILEGEAGILLAPGGEVHPAVMTFFQSGAARVTREKIQELLPQYSWRKQDGEVIFNIHFP